LFSSVIFFRLSGDYMRHIVSQSRQMSSEETVCCNCNGPTQPAPEAKGCFYCDACDEVVIFDGVIPLWQSPEEARFPSMDAAIEAAMPHLVKLVAGIVVSGAQQPEKEAA
jgi:hypothetical protein